MKSLWSRCGDLWCEFMHNGAMWPIHGAYRCRQCLRSRAVPWEQAKPHDPRPDQSLVARENGLLAA